MKEELDQRKKDHIDLALNQGIPCEHDKRFNYEPLFHAHPDMAQVSIESTFLGTTFKAPIWISSMTGGTQEALKINQNLAKAVLEFGLGMGLGSCRAYSKDPSSAKQFEVRSILGDRPLYANLGMAQVEDWVMNGHGSKITELVKSLEADGLIVHINPLQEWFQPEGDTWRFPPLVTLKRLLDCIDFPIIVKEVGQGMGSKSLRELCLLPLKSIEFGAFGGTNFSQIEFLRHENPARMQCGKPLIHVGHSAGEMVDMINRIKEDLGTKCLVEDIIISGGISTALDGFELRERSHLNAIYGLARRVLPYAQSSYDDLKAFLESEIATFKMAACVLEAKHEQNGAGKQFNSNS